MFLDPKVYVPVGLGIVLIFAAFIITTTNSCDDEEACNASKNPWVMTLWIVGLSCLLLAGFFRLAFHFNAFIEDEAANLVFGRN